MVPVLSVGILCVAVVPVAVVPVAVIPVAMAATKLRDDRVRNYVCGKDARGGAEPGKLPPDVVLQQHIRMCPPAFRNQAVRSVGSAGATRRRATT